MFSFRQSLLVFFVLYYYSKQSAVRAKSKKWNVNFINTHRVYQFCMFSGNIKSSTHRRCLQSSPYITHFDFLFYQIFIDKLKIAFSETLSILPCRSFAITFHFKIIYIESVTFLRLHQSIYLYTVKCKIVLC